MARVTEEHVEARQNQILDAAWICFAERGYHRATMQDIAAKAGLSTGAIYLYYENKEALALAINRRSMELSRRIIEAARSQSSTPLEAMRAIGAAMLSIFTDPGFETATKLNIEMWPEIIRSPELAASTRREIGFWRKEVAKLLAEAQEEGLISADADPDTLAMLSICAWEGLRHYKLIDPTISEEILVSLVQPIGQAGSAPKLAADDELKARMRLRSAPWIIPDDAKVEGQDGDR
jgi:AcrR family transcriptional regulator